MTIEICAVGGYSEVGRNCVAVKYGDEVVLLDMGLHMEHYVQYMEDEEPNGVSPQDLTLVNAIPDITHIKDWKSKVKAIVPSHAHLDHIGAIPFLAGDLKCPVIATPFTIEVLRAIIKDNSFKLKNKLLPINPNSSYDISENLKVEFIHITHSTPHAAMIALHTPEGIVLYANDFKLDNYPVLGSKPNYKRLEQIRGKVKVLISECLYINQMGKMPSESVAKQMLREVMLETNSKGKAVVVSTFSSHIARLKSIIDFGKKMGRKVVFLGRSLNRYVTAAEKCGLVDFTKDVGMILYGARAKKFLKKVSRKKEEYLLVMTGHQGEPRAMLSRVIDGDYEFPMDSSDFVIFSCITIPSPTTIANRKALEKKLKDRGVRMFTNIHVSGHAAREDLHEFIQMVKPEHIIPSHGEPAMLADMADMLRHLDYGRDKVHLLLNGQRVTID